MPSTTGLTRSSSFLADRATVCQPPKKQCRPHSCVMSDGSQTDPWKAVQGLQNVSKALQKAGTSLQARHAFHQLSNASAHREDMMHYTIEEDERLDYYCRADFSVCLQASRQNPATRERALSLGKECKAVICHLLVRFPGPPAHTQHAVKSSPELLRLGLSQGCHHAPCRNTSAVLSLILSQQTMLRRWERPWKSCSMMCLRERTPLWTEHERC